MRDVRQAIQNVIQDLDVQREFLIATEPILRSIEYAAPETQGGWWEKFCDEMKKVFATQLYIEQQNWAQKATAILRGELDYRDYL